MKWDSMRKDILKELINVYIGRAASILSEVVEKKIDLAVPKIHILDSTEYNSISQDDLPECMQGAIMLSRIKFKKELEGFAELIFPLKHIRKITALCLSREEADFILQDTPKFSDIDFDVIKELGNIVLNAVIGGFGDFLNMQIDYSLPEVSVFDKIEIKERTILHKKMHMLILYVTFTIDTTEIEGAMIINFTINSMKELLAEIDRLKTSLGE